MGRFLDRFENGMLKTAYWICMISLLIMLLLVVIVVFGRYFFSYTPAWSEELALFLMTWVGLFSASIAEQNKTHIRLSFIDRFYPRALLRIFGLIRYLLKVTFFGMMTYYGYILFSRTKLKFGAIPISYKWQFLPGLLTGIFCLTFLLLHIKKELTDRYDHVNLEDVS